MQITSTPVPDSRVTLPATKAAESAVSAVSWPAIIAGAVAIAAVALILLALGSGLGLSSVSPSRHALNGLIPARRVDHAPDRFDLMGAAAMTSPRS